MHMTVPHAPAADGSDALEVTLEQLRERIAELERALVRLLDHANPPEPMARLAAGRWTASYGPGAVVLELVRRHGIARVLRHAARIRRALEAREQEQDGRRAA